MYGTLCLTNTGFRFHPFNGDKREQIDYLNEWERLNGNTTWKNNIQVFDIPGVKKAYVVFDKAKGRFLDAIGCLTKEFTRRLFFLLCSTDCVFEERLDLIGLTTEEQRELLQKKPVGRK